MLIVGATLALLAAWGLTAGSLLTPIHTFLAVWFGWGSYLLIGVAAALGMLLIGRQARITRWSRVFALETAALLALGILSMLGGNSLVRADAGLDGGRLGWGIAYLGARYLGPVVGSIVLALLFLGLAAGGIGGWEALERRIVRMAGEEPGEAVLPPAMPTPAAEDESLPPIFISLVGAVCTLDIALFSNQFRGK